GLVSGIAQGKAAAAGVGIVAKRPEELGKAITFAAIVETYALLLGNQPLRQNVVFVLTSLSIIFFWSLSIV
ncbi:hypothetical protein ACTPEF_27015, partial [Clostridioides difficile]